jgi:hypothetical protein
MRLYPFRGIRYGEGLADRGSLAAPPYDQIDDALAADLRETPHQFAWLTRPIASDRGDPYETARRTHEEWLATGTLQKEQRPALYPYEILLPNGGRQLGLTALVGLEDPSSQIIRPHEQTVDKTVEERLALLRTTGLDLEPILLLNDDDGGLDSLLAEDLADGAFLIEHQDSFGNRHRLFRLEDADRIERYRRLLESCPGLIADGHHRYEVAIRHATERGLELGSDNATKLTVITSLNWARPPPWPKAVSPARRRRGAHWQPPQQQLNNPPSRCFRPHTRPRSGPLQKRKLRSTRSPPPILWLSCGFTKPFCLGSDSTRQRQATAGSPTVRIQSGCFLQSTTATSKLASGYLRCLLELSPGRPPRELCCHRNRPGSYPRSSPVWSGPVSKESASDAKNPVRRIRIGFPRADEFP